jgi:excisionase family DNA binding protein
MVTTTGESLVLTIQEAAKILRIGRSAAYEAVRTGELPVIQFGRRKLVPRAALEKLLMNAGKDQQPILMMKS